MTALLWLLAACTAPLPHPSDRGLAADVHSLVPASEPGAPPAAEPVHDGPPLIALALPVDAPGADVFARQLRLALPHDRVVYQPGWLVLHPHADTAAVLAALPELDLGDEAMAHALHTRPDGAGEVDADALRTLWRATLTRRRLFVSGDAAASADWDEGTALPATSPPPLDTLLLLARLADRDSATSALEAERDRALHVVLCPSGLCLDDEPPSDLLCDPARRDEAAAMAHAERERRLDDPAQRAWLAAYRWRTGVDLSPQESLGCTELGALVTHFHTFGVD